MFLANTSAQLIDLSLEKGWYVSLQSPSLNDLKLDVELYKVLLASCVLQNEGHATSAFTEGDTVLSYHELHPPLHCIELADGCTWRSEN